MLKDIQPFWKNRGSVKFKGIVYDCGELDKYIELMNEYLLQKQYEKNQAVGICLDRGVELLALLYAMLQRGIPFLLLSGNTPENRRDYMIRHIGISHIITEEKYMREFEGFQTVCIGEMKKIKKAERPEGEYHRAKKQDIAYYIYTSGSTGRPKAVEVSQRNLRNFVREFPEKFSFEKKSHILNLASVTFDLFILESAFAMYQGFEAVLAAEEERGNIAGICELLRSNTVDIIEITPSHLRMLYTYDKQFTMLKEVKHLLIGGEKFPKHLLLELQKNTNCKIYNMYGLTETTIWASAADLTKDVEVHIGTPINGYQFLILNKDGEACGEGETGELYILGEGVTNGYKNDSLLTERQFVQSKLDETARMYKTGDLVKYQNGKYFCSGRYDNQIKYGGNRIELEEIDECCMAIPEIKNALTYFMEEKQYLLVLYESEKELKPDYLRSRLRAELYEYMLPKCFIKAEKLFFSENGKLDRKKNYQMYIEDNKVLIGTKEETGGSAEDRVLEIVEKILPDKDAGIKVGDALQDIGIDSINFIRLVIALEEAFGLAFDEKMLSMKRFERIQDIINYIKIRSEE